MKTLRIILLLLSGAVPMAALLIWSGPVAPHSSIANMTANGAPAVQTSPEFRDAQNYSAQTNNPTYNRFRWRHFQSSGDWAKFMEFMRVNSPNRYQMISSAPNVPRQMLARRWQEIEQIKDKQPQLYEYRVEQIQKEDDVIGLLFQYRQAQKNNDTIAEGQAYEKIRDDAKDLVNLSLEDRELRLDNIGNLLNQARQDLEHDKGKVDATVTDKTRQIITKTKSLPLFDAQPNTSQASPGANGQ